MSAEKPAASPRHHPENLNLQNGDDVPDSGRHSADPRSPSIAARTPPGSHTPKSPPSGHRRPSTSSGPRTPHSVTGSRRPSVQGSRRPSVSGSRRPSVSGPRRPSVMLRDNSLRRPSSPRHPWDPRGEREPRPWTPRPSIGAQQSADVEAAIGRQCQVLWCSRNMHVWYVFVLLLPMLVSLVVGVHWQIRWLTILAAVVLAVYACVYVAGLLNFLCCGMDCRSGAPKGRTAAYCEALLTAAVPTATMIALIVFVSF